MKKLLIILIVLNIAMPTAFARQQGSSIPPRTVLSKDTINPGFDATQQIFQKRYQHPDAVPFDTLWKNNVYFSLFGGMDKMIPRGNADFNTGRRRHCSQLAVRTRTYFARFTVSRQFFTKNRQRNISALRIAGRLSAECVILCQRLQPRTYL